MNSMLNGYLRHFEEMMRAGHQRDRPYRDEDIFCRSCRYFRPDWEYRYCRFTECPYICGLNTFRREARDDAE